MNEQKHFQNRYIFTKYSSGEQSIGGRKTKVLTWNHPNDPPRKNKIPCTLLITFFSSKSNIFECACHILKGLFFFFHARRLILQLHCHIVLNILNSFKIVTAFQSQVWILTGYCKKDVKSLCIASVHTYHAVRLTAQLS